MFTEARFPGEANRNIKQNGFLVFHYERLQTSFFVFSEKWGWEVNAKFVT